MRILATTLLLLALGSSSLPAASGRTLRGAITVGGVQRTYLLHLPRGYSSAWRPAPLVFFFHGGDGSGAIGESFSQFSPLADKKGFLVAYPDGLHGGWNDGRNAPAIISQRDNVDDVGFVSALLDDLLARYRVDPKRVFASGVSNGGFFATRVGAELADRIAAIAPVISLMAPQVADAFSPAEPISVLMINGTADPHVPYEGGPITFADGSDRGSGLSTMDTVGKWTAFEGCQPNAKVTNLPDSAPRDGTRVKLSTWSGCEEGAEVLLYTVVGGGHTWPGGPQYLPRAIVGRVCRDFDATPTIWSFFARHKKP
jgi:polyhydroxybutyrate depolymerase